MNKGLAIFGPYPPPIGGVSIHISRIEKHLIKENIDYLVLGCTHYPYLIPQIQKIVGGNVAIIDSGLAVARQTNAILEKMSLKTTSDEVGKHQFYINTNTAVLQTILSDVKLNHSVKKLDF